MKPIKYLIIGILVTIVNWGTYALGGYFELPVIISNIFAFCAATIVSFLGNSLWTFSSNIEGEKFIKFVSGRIITGVIIENILLMILIYCGLSQPIFNIQAFYSKLIAATVSTILNYLYCKLIFKSEKLFTDASPYDIIKSK